MGGRDGSSWGNRGMAGPAPAARDTWGCVGFFCLGLPRLARGREPQYLSLRPAGDQGAQISPSGQFLGGFVTFPSKGSLSGQSSFLFFITELMCGFLPTQQSFLGFSSSPRTCSVKPHGPAHSPLSGAARARWWGATGLSWPLLPPLPQGHLCPSRLCAEAAPTFWLCLRGLFLLLILGAVQVTWLVPTISSS